jgi:hypothetical protein
MRETSELDLRSSKRREMCYGLAKSPPLPPNSDITHITLEETQSRRLGQNQQSPASRTPSLEHLIHTNPAPSLLPNVNSPKYDGPHSVSGDGMATDGIAHQSFGHLDPASSQSNPADGSCGAFLTQHLQYARQPGAPPNPQQGGRNLEPDNVLAAETSDLGSGAGPSAGIGDNYAHYFPESDNIFRTEAPGLGPLAGPTAGTINNYFPVSDNVFRAENPDEGSGPGAAAGTGNNYAHYFPDPDDVFRTEAPGAGSGPGLIADSGDNYAHYFPELHEGDRGVYEGNCAGEPSSITWLTSQ